MAGVVIKDQEDCTGKWGLMKTRTNRIEIRTSR